MATTTRTPRKVARTSKSPQHKTITHRFVLDHDTKGTHVYLPEDPDSAFTKQLYLFKSAVGEHAPEAYEVTLTPSK